MSNGYILLTVMLGTALLAGAYIWSARIRIARADKRAREIVSSYTGRQVMRDEYGPKPMSKLLRQWLWAGFWLAVTVVLFVLAVKVQPMPYGLIALFTGVLMPFTPTSWRND